MLTPAELAQQNELEAMQVLSEPAMPPLRMSRSQWKKYSGKLRTLTSIHKELANKTKGKINQILPTDFVSLMVNANQGQGNLV